MTKRSTFPLRKLSIALLPQHTEKHGAIPIMTQTLNIANHNGCNFSTTEETDKPDIPPNLGGQVVAIAQNRSPRFPGEGNETRNHRR
jgi:hypothetical protein